MYAGSKYPKRYMCHDAEEKAFKRHFSLNDPSHDNHVTLTLHILMRFRYRSIHSLFLLFIAGAFEARKDILARTEND